MLECLSNPINTKIQYRYTEDLISPEVLTDLEKIKNKKGLVCFAQTETPGVAKIVPAREVKILSYFKHGSSISFTLQLLNFVYADPNTITQEIIALGCVDLPRDEENTNIARPKSGFYFLKLPKLPGSITVDNEISTWEDTIKIFSQSILFKEEKIFITIPGIIRTRSDDKDNLIKFQKWPGKLRPGKTYTLLIYLFHPDKDSWEADSLNLKIISSLKIYNFHPEDLEIDSAYDLRRWRFKILHNSLLNEKRGWFTLSIFQSKKHTRSMAFPYSVSQSWIRIIGTILILGLLIASPSAISVWSKDVPHSEKIYSTLVSVVFGLVTSFVAVFGIKRII